MNRTCSDLKYILFISDGFDRMFSSLWSYVVISTVFSVENKYTLACEQSI